MTASAEPLSPRLARALAAARDTRELILCQRALSRVDEVVYRHFFDLPALLVGDHTTISLAREQVASPIKRAQTFVFDDPHFHAEWKFVEQLESAAKSAPPDAFLVAIGSGTINDLTKLVAHRLGRKYLCVATAASMDGYTAFGASITKDGSKQTFECPAPLAVIADIDIIAAAPNELTASGYADLLAKVTAGADWILADALGVEAIHPHAWETVQGTLRSAVEDPAAVRLGDVRAIEKLTEGLLMGGFAMQAMQSSRPASGAEHQFSHLWDMQHHTHNGEPPSHGFKVGIGTLAVAKLYETFLQQPIEKLDVDKAVAQASTWGQVQQNIRSLFDIEELREKSIEESRNKFSSGLPLGGQLNRLREVWPTLRDRLRTQLLPATTIAKMLAESGAPSTSGEIGISPERLQKSHRQALYIRRRFTILDIADRLGILP